MIKLNPIIVKRAIREQLGFKNVKMIDTTNEKLVFKCYDHATKKDWIVTMPAWNNDIVLQGDMEGHIVSILL